MLLWKSMSELTVGKLFVNMRANSGALAAKEVNVVAPLNLAASAETVTATRTLTAAESGKTIFLSSATEFVTTLPLPQSGLSFKFVVAAAPSGADYTIFTNGGANIIKGAVYSSDLNAAGDADIEISGGDTISFVSAAAVAGDTVELLCDGTNWFARGFCSLVTGITITTAA